MITGIVMWGLKNDIRMPGLFLLAAMGADVAIVFYIGQALRGCV